MNGLEQLRDIEGVIGVPWLMTLRYSVLILLSILFLGGLVAFWRRLRERRKLTRILPPYEEAILQVSKLAGMLRRGAGDFAFYDALDAALRRYIGRRFNLDIAKLTSMEIKQLAHPIIPENLVPVWQELVVLFERSDPVRFADQMISAAESAKDLQWFKALVEKHR